MLGFCEEYHREPCPDLGHADAFLRSDLVLPRVTQRLATVNQQKVVHFAYQTRWGRMRRDWITAPLEVFRRKQERLGTILNFLIPYPPWARNRRRRQ
jgi:hypothetical protein